MQLEIKGIERELRFGTGFVRKLDEVYQVNVKGMEFGAGLMIANLQLTQMNPAALSDVIRCAVKGNPKQNDMDDFIDSYAEENDGLKDLFDELISEMGKSLVVKDTMDRAEKAKVKAETEEV